MFSHVDQTISHKIDRTCVKFLQADNPAAQGSGQALLAAASKSCVDVTVSVARGHELCASSRASTKLLVRVDNNIAQNAKIQRQRVGRDRRSAGQIQIACMEAFRISENACSDRSAVFCTISELYS